MPENRVTETDIKIAEIRQSYDQQSRKLMTDKAELQAEIHRLQDGGQPGDDVNAKTRVYARLSRELALEGMQTELRRVDDQLRGLRKTRDHQIRTIERRVRFLEKHGQPEA